MNYRDFTVEDVLESGLNIKNDSLSSLLDDKGIISTLKRKGCKVIVAEDNKLLQ